MKYLKLYENSSDDEFKKFIERSVKNGNITLNIDIDELLIKNKSPKIGTFEYFFENDDDFISAGDSNRMSEYVDKLKEMGSNVSRLESLLIGYIRYHKITHLEDDLMMDMNNTFDEDEDEEKKIQIEIDKLLDEQDSLINTKLEFEKELRKVIKDAK